MRLHDTSTHIFFHETANLLHFSKYSHIIAATRPIQDINELQWQQTQKDQAGNGDDNEI
jgi:hypothetical protein